MLVGISGKIGSGKDSVGGFLHYLYNYHANGRTEEISFDNYLLYRRYGFNKNECAIKKFAGKLKEIVCLMIGCNLSDLEDHKFKNTELGPEWDVWSHPFAGGVLFSTYNEAKRDLDDYKSFVGESYNYDLIEHRVLTPRKLMQILGTECGTYLIHPNIWINSLLKDYTSDKTWIITDTRFVNEAEAILSKGGFLIRLEKDIFYEFDKDNNQHIVYDMVGKEHNLMGFNAEVYSKEEAIKKFEFEVNGSLHVSETALDNYKSFGAIIKNDGSLEDLFNRVKDIYFTHLKDR